METNLVESPVIDRISPIELVPQETCEANTLLETMALIKADCLVAPEPYLKQLQLVSGGE